MENGTKNRLLCIIQLLKQHTDPEHPKSTVELIQMLKSKYDIEVSRNTICDDLKKLRESDLPIECEPSTQNIYHYDGYPFAISELKILIEIISSAKFITETISYNLIYKLLKLTTEENAAQLRKNISVEGYVKSDSCSGYYSVDTINKAINLQKKISFRYTDYDIHMQKYVTNDGNPYTLSPYELICDANYYYVRGYCDEYRSMRTFRLDRIAEQPTVLSEVIKTPPKNYNPAEYKRTVFRMFDTEKTTKVELLCDVSTMKYIIDNFGKDIRTEVTNDHAFKIHVKVCDSLTFYRWVFGFAGKIQIIGPENIVKRYKSMLTSALDNCK